MGRKYDFLEKQVMDEKSNYESPTCVELKKIVGDLPYRSSAWSKEDELTVLQKLFEFSTQHSNSNSYTTHFYNYVNKMLSVQLFENELCYMIFLLRKQYLDHHHINYSHEKDLDSHALKVMELSAKIWKVSDSMDAWQPKTSVVRDAYDRELQAYAVDAVGVEADCCLSPHVMEEVNRDWQRFKFVEHEYRRMQFRLSLRLLELKANMHNTHLKTPPQP